MINKEVVPQDIWKHIQGNVAAEICSRIRSVYMEIKLQNQM